MSLSIHDDYKLGRTIGQGHFAQVKEAVDRRTGRQVAVKCFTISDEKEQDKMKARKEMRIMSHIDHPNCVQLLGAYASSKRIYVVMELLTGGELFDRIIAKEQYSEAEAMDCFTQIMSAVEYLHFKGVCHRDVKPENILYATPAEDSPIKLVDFGLGSLLDLHSSSHHTLMRTVVGTPAYAAPELIAKRSRGDQDAAYGLGCDVWSCGVILYCMLSGEHPFDQHMGVHGLFHQISNGLYTFEGDVWGDVSSEAKHLIRTMMAVDPAARPRAGDCLRHPWCTSARPAAGGARKNLTIAQMQLKERAERTARQKLLLPAGGGTGRRAHRRSGSVTSLSDDGSTRSGRSSPRGAAGGGAAGGGGAAEGANREVGCLLARGENLEVIFINSHLKALLACPGDSDPSPKSVNDIMDGAFVATHRRFMAKVVADGAIPRSLQHPLRAVHLRRKDGSGLTLNVCIGALEARPGARVDSETVFFAYCAEHRPDAPAATVADAMARAYGHRVAEAALRGEASPAPQLYDEATVVLVSLPPSPPPSSKTSVASPPHRAGRDGDDEAAAAVREIAARARMQVVDLDSHPPAGGGAGGAGGGRGRGVSGSESGGGWRRMLCVAGTNHVERDLEFDQAQRAVGFAAAVAARLGGRAGRLGLATGPVEMAFKLHMGGWDSRDGGQHGERLGDAAAAAAAAAAAGTLSVSYSVVGAAVTKAAAAERLGRPGEVRVTRSAAARLRREAACGDSDAARYSQCLPRDYGGSRRDQLVTGRNQPAGGGDVGHGAGGGGDDGRGRRPSESCTGSDDDVSDEESDGAWLDCPAAAAVAAAAGILPPPPANSSAGLQDRWGHGACKSVGGKCAAAAAAAAAAAGTGGAAAAAVWLLLVLVAMLAAAAAGWLGVDSAGGGVWWWESFSWPCVRWACVHWPGEAWHPLPWAGLRMPGPAAETLAWVAPEPTAAAAAAAGGESSGWW